MGTFSYTYWIVAPKSGHVNEKLASYFGQFADDRLEEHVRCSNGPGIVMKTGWRADRFDELKPVIRSFPAHEIEVFRCPVGESDAVPWRVKLLKHLPRRARYSRPPRRKKAAAA